MTSNTIPQARRPHPPEPSKTVDGADVARNNTPAPLPCLLCGGLEHRPVFNEFGIDILRCRQCRHVFSSFAANPHFDGFWGDEVPDAEHHYWSHARARMHGDFFRRFLAGRSGRLLDMGCGLGFFLKGVAGYPAWEAYGCEISPAAARYARGKLGLKNILCGPPEQADVPPASFDIITLWDVIDHFLQPDPLLSHCHALLKTGGICFIRTPNLPVHLFRARLKKAVRGMKTGTSYLQATDHPHHYSKASIRRLLERNGFTDVNFVHLHPIGSEKGGEGALARGLKNLSFEIVRALSVVSGGHLNFDNLFVVARKTVASAPLSSET